MYFINGAAQMNGPSFGDNIIMNYLAGISGSLFIFTISKISLGLPKSVKTISRNTLFLIFYHWLFLCVCSKLRIISLLTSTDNPWIRILEMIIMTCIVLCSSVYVVRILESKMPVLLGKYKR